MCSRCKIRPATEGHKQCKECQSSLRKQQRRRYKNRREDILKINKKSHHKNIYSKKQEWLKKIIGMTPSRKWLGKSRSWMGYVLLYFKGGFQYPEHRWIMMKELKRPLETWEHIHHINGIKSDNRLENLEVTPGHIHLSVTQLIKENAMLRQEIRELKTKEIYYG